MIGRDGVEVNRTFSAGTFRVSRDLGRTPQVRPSESVLWRTGNEFCAFGAKNRPEITRAFLRTHLINVVAASLCRGASVTLLTGGTATQRRGYSSAYL